MWRRHNLTSGDVERVLVLLQEMSTLVVSGSDRAPRVLKEYNRILVNSNPNVTESGECSGEFYRGTFIGSGCALGAAAVVALLLACRSFRSHRARRKSRRKLQGTLSKINMDVELLTLATRLDWSDIALADNAPVATGSYGEVWRGYLHKRHEVAVKLLTKNEEKSAHRTSDEEEGSNPLCGIDDAELRFLQRARHKNLVMFFGGGIDDNGKGFVVLEFMNRGDFSNFLWDDGDEVLDWTLRLALLGDAAAGMRFLHDTISSIHRDLKSPNILLASDNTGTLVAKIADFGMAKVLGRRKKDKYLERRRSFHDSDEDDEGDGDEDDGFQFYEGKNDEKKDGDFGDEDKENVNLAANRKSRVRKKRSMSKKETVASKEADVADVPSAASEKWTETAMTTELGTPQWMAPEVIATVYSEGDTARYTQAVDVYSFGIIMWETLSLRAPWKKYKRYFEVWKMVSEGKRPPIDPDDAAEAPKGYIELMRDCWSQSPSERPHFRDIQPALNIIGLPRDHWETLPSVTSILE
eukprot:g4320.t1